MIVTLNPLFPLHLFILGFYFVSSFITYSSVTSLCLIQFLFVCIWKVGYISGSWSRSSLMREAAYAFQQHPPLVTRAIWSRGTS